MSAAYQEIVPVPPAFDGATETFSALKAHMRAAEAMEMTQGELEAHVIEKMGTIAREMLQSHLDLRSGAERVVRVVGDDGIVERQARAHDRRSVPAKTSPQRAPMLDVEATAPRSAPYCVRLLPGDRRRFGLASR